MEDVWGVVSDSDVEVASGDPWDASEASSPLAAGEELYELPAPVRAAIAAIPGPEPQATQHDNSCQDIPSLFADESPKSVNQAANMPCNDVAPEGISGGHTPGRASCGRLVESDDLLFPGETQSKKARLGSVDDPILESWQIALPKPPAGTEWWTAPLGQAYEHLRRNASGGRAPSFPLTHEEFGAGTYGVMWIFEARSPCTLSTTIRLAQRCICTCDIRYACVYVIHQLLLWALVWF